MTNTLPDIERKVLRIYVNESLHGRQPTLKQLSTYTGKSEDDLKGIVKSLMEKGHLVVRDGKVERIVENPVKF
ncbi:hypothetical protein [Scopulibacillus darangshiensis]|uniref:hypothetical protein n=1 Tax=Scopulibacillus darangshiensis TaxID=442528 RepID=UPI00104FE63C|nr:hypothetical protein [Scopulibacillus darangshiensis]